MVIEEAKTKFYTAKTDRVFKTIMSKNIDILEAVISQSLEKNIKIIRFINPELNIANVKERVKTVDVLIESEGTYINLELNTEYNIVTKIRNQSYFAAFYHQHTTRGREYNSENEFIQVNLSFGMSKKEKIKREYKFRDEEGKVRDATLTIVDINMDKINEMCYYGTENYSKYKYLYMLDQESNILKEISGEDELVEKFKNEVERLNSDPEFVWGLTGEEDAEKMQRSLISLKAKEAENKQMVKIC